MYHQFADAQQFTPADSHQPHKHKPQASLPRCGRVRRCLKNMKCSLVLFAVVGTLSFLRAEETPSETFLKGFERLRMEFRANQAQLLKKADRVIVYVVEEGITFEDPLTDETIFINIRPSGMRAKIRKARDLEGKDKEKLLEALSKQIAVPKHTGGAIPHDPCHGLRIYREKQLLYEGTFSWTSCNFSFVYPAVGAEFLDTNEELKTIFSQLLPIPQEELERYRASSSVRSEGEQSTPAATPTSPTQK